MKKYLSVILWIILTACLVAYGSSDKDSVNDDKQEVRLRKMNMPEREVVELLSNGDVELKISKEWNWCFWLSVDSQLPVCRDDMKNKV